jgi:hypothetical protein
LALAALTLLSGCATPMGVQPEPTGQIDGAVVDPLLSPFRHLSVRLVELGREDITSDLGGFTFRNVPVGVWTLQAEAHGTKGATATIVVNKDETTPIILQLFPVDPPPGVMKQAGKTGADEMALPNTECPGCEWVILLSEHPEEVVFEFTWEDVAGRSSPIHATVHTVDGTNVLDLTGTSPLRGSVVGDRLGATEPSLRVSVSFGPDFIPQTDFRVEELADFYYGATRAQYLDQQ